MRNCTLSQCMTKPVWPEKTQISLYIHPVCHGFLFIPLDCLEAVEGTCDQWRLWPDCVDAQADLSLHWLYKSYCRFCCALAPLWVIPKEDSDEPVHLCSLMKAVHLKKSWNIYYLESAKSLCYKCSNLLFILKYFEMGGKVYKILYAYTRQI